LAYSTDEITDWLIDYLSQIVVEDTIIYIIAGLPNGDVLTFEPENRTEKLTEKVKLYNDNITINEIKQLIGKI